MQIALVTCLLSTIVGEFVNGRDGLGARILAANNVLDIAQVFAVMIILGCMAALFDWVLRFADLAREGDRMVWSLPGGWKQRVALGAAILHEPSVLFLDEPTSGVDVNGRLQIRDIIRALAAGGCCVVLATHELDEAVTDPELDGWYAANGEENGDRCAWQYGTGYAVGKAMANMHLGARDYYIQSNWLNSGGGRCALSAGATVG